MPFRYLYLGQYESMAAALTAKAAALHVLYGPDPEGGGGGGAGVSASVADVKAMAARLIVGKQGDLVRGVMKQHGTLDLLKQ